ncbi:helix-turn-helix domain-containing protein [Serratia symbiotica]|uniref:Helix-turn-helix transcriptional regulator n=1 Tax=Serratia symbiotica TaxID=138074 RepID=A0A068YZ21_9GAMM|nr:helix-turn-helix transcriptional regulator [Serratia symbiotica]MBF1995688.1 helix-turn-helix transcriptional regulator [Serratia symbiotica]QLH61697.1 helix-turn-helix transcriptional regulator [Serratia symbiotica]CDS56848.1 Repressor protein C [Serratia symbiotica]
MSTNVGRKIQLMRKSEMLTQKQMADITGVSIASLTQYEQGRNVPSLESIVKIFKHPRFRKYHDWFLFDETELKAGQVVPALAHIGQESTKSSQSEKKTG